MLMATAARPARIAPAPHLGMSTWAYLAAFLRHPMRAWARLLVDPARLRHGFVAVLVVGLGYAVTAGIAWSEGTPSTPSLPCCASAR